MPQNKSKFTHNYKIDYPEGASKAERDAINEEVGTYLVEQTLKDVGQSKSPVKGGRFRAQLTKEYAEVKSGIAGSTRANMELYGDMLDALEYKKSAKGVWVGINDSKQAVKAYGHNTGFKGHPNSKMRGDKYKREFIPKKGQGYKASIDKEVNKIILEVHKDFMEDEEDEEIDDGE